MRRFALVLCAVLVLSGGATWAWHRDQRLPGSGELTLMRDEGGCLVGLNQGVRVRWSPGGATLESVTDTMTLGPGGTFGPWQREAGAARPISLERARALARMFEQAAGEAERPLKQFAARTMSIELSADGATQRGHLDCRADYGRALALEAEAYGDRWDWVRLQAYRAGLWRPAGEQVDPVLTGLMAELTP